MQEIIDWVHSIILDNMSHTVIVDLGYDNMEKMSLVTHLQCLGVTEWHQIRSEVTEWHQIRSEGKLPRLIYDVHLLAPSYLLTLSGSRRVQNS